MTPAKAATKKTTVAKKASTTAPSRSRKDPATSPEPWTPPAGRTTPDAPTEPKTVEFLGRTLRVKMPTLEQIAAWRTVVKRLEGAERDGLTAEQVLPLVARMQRILSSVVIDEADLEWIEDGRVDGTVTMANSSSIITDTIQAYKNDKGSGADEASPNRAARRAR